MNATTTTQIRTRNRRALATSERDVAPDTPIGLLAGWGDFPVIVARTLKAQGYRVHCLGIRGHAPEELKTICDEFRYIGLTRLGGQIRFFRRRGVRRATMAGKIFKDKVMFRRFSWLWHLPDLRCVTTFYPHFVTKTQDRRDDTLLTAVVDEFAKDDILFAPATDFATELLVQPGMIAGRPLSSGLVKDIAFGWNIAKELGRLDVGQSVAVKGLACLAVEAVEGTDACIRRAGELCQQGSFTVVKVAKPKQDMRFDVPTIGVGTIESMIAAGAHLLAVEGGRWWLEATYD